MWNRVLAMAATMASVVTAGIAMAQEPPVIPVGLDAYRQWERWPYLRIGQQTFMRSTYDRRGGNEGADASHFLYQLPGDRSVPLDLEGPGVINFIRYNHWHGSPWYYVIDGSDFVLRETSTADPNHPKEGATFLPADLFPEPLAFTWATTRGADLIGVPIPFANSFRMEYERTHYGTGYYIYSRYVPGARLSQPIRAWGRRPPAADVTELIGRAGSDIAPQMGSPEGRGIGLREDHGTVSSLEPSATLNLSHIRAKALAVRAIEFTVPRDQALAFGRARLRITWDDRQLPSVDAPVALFFGAGTLYNRDNREYLVKAFPVNIRFDATRVHLACFFPMPFFKSAKIDLVASADKVAVKDIRWSVRTGAFQARPEQVGYFHATYRDHPRPEAGRDLTLLDTREAEGGGDWSGHLVGTSFIFSHNANLGTLEGDPRFFFDDSKTPQVQGTGTEEWGGGGDYWGGLNMTLPFVGHPVGARSLELVRHEEDKIESAYRFLLADLMPFGRNARICLEHGGTNESTEHYETVAYWYGRPGAMLVQTDVFQVGDIAAEKVHGYLSLQASEPVTISSRYEWGVDHVKGIEVYPEETGTGRTTTGASEFTLAIDPKNVGVVLRRKLDYRYPNQRAEVSVSEVQADGAASSTLWKPAGIWYLAGSNTCLYSNPREETGAAQHIVQTSNRRFRDDDFLLPRALTKGRSAIRVRVKFTPVDRPLFPGEPAPPSAWSEMRYTAYCYLAGR